LNFSGLIFQLEADCAFESNVLSPHIWGGHQQHMLLLTEDIAVHITN